MAGEQVTNKSLRGERSRFNAYRKAKLQSVTLIICITALSLICLVLEWLGILPAYQTGASFSKTEIGAAVGLGLLLVLLVFRILKAFWIRLRPVRCFCPHCGKFISNDEQWKCGRCDQVNVPANRIQSFLTKCTHCSASPESLVCPYEGCGKQIILYGITADVAHAAKILRTNAAPEPKLTPEEERKNKKLELEHKILVAELDAKFAHADAQLKMAKGEEEPVETDLKKSRDRYLGVDLAYRKALKEFEEEFADDPERLQRSKDWLESWRESKSI